jgi:hypothetical protein
VWSAHLNSYSDLTQAARAFLLDANHGCITIGRQHVKAFYLLSAAERARLTREALAKCEPLMALWMLLEPEFGEEWRNRAVAAAEWLGEASSVVDLGCGTMKLESCLAPEQVYIPVDVVARDERTLVLDLNKSLDLERLPAADACVMLGFLEYSYVPDELVSTLRRCYRQVVTTFSVLYESPAWRLEQGWVNHFTRSEVVELFARHGFRMMRERHFQGRQYMYDFR